MWHCLNKLALAKFAVLRNGVSAGSMKIFTMFKMADGRKTLKQCRRLSSPYNFRTRRDRLATITLVSSSALPYLRFRYFDTRAECGRSIACVLRRRQRALDLGDSYMQRS